MLVVFFELWAAPASILGRPGQVSEPSKRHLTMFFGVRTRVSQKCSSCNKTTVFAMFYRLRNMPHIATEHVFCIAFKAFLDMVYGLLQKIPAGIHLLLFITTLQRGGTCAAHRLRNIFFNSVDVTTCNFFCLELPSFIFYLTHPRARGGLNRLGGLGRNFSNFFDQFSKNLRFWLGGAAPQTPWFLAGGAKPPQTLHWTTHPIL